MPKFKSKRENFKLEKLKFFKATSIQLIILLTKDVKPVPEEHRGAWENHFDKILKQKGKLQIRKSKGFQKAKAFWDF